MHGISVAGLRRLALGAALVVVFIIAAAYGWNAWQAARARRLAPAVIPTDVRQQAAGFTFSRSEKGQTLFTVRASRTKDFKERNRSLLEDVWITIYGKQSDRSDHIHTDRCDYDAEAGLVECAGEVKLDLEGTLGATLEAGPTVQRVARNPIHIETSQVTFDQSTGIARTDRLVRFSFQFGSGRAEGLTYNTRAGVVDLHRDIEIQIRRIEKGQSVPIMLRGNRMRYTKAERRLSLEPPLSVTQPARQLTAQNLSLYLDESFQAQRAEATGTVNATSAEPGRALQMSAAKVVGFFAPRGSGLERLEASGHVRLDSKSPRQTAALEAERVELRFDAMRQEAREARATGSARFQVTLPAEMRTWSAPTIALHFRPAGRELARGRSEGASVFEITPSTQPEEHRRVSGQRFELEFDEASRLERFRAAGTVRVDVLRPGQPTQSSASDELFAEFDKVRGTLKAADQIGHFSFREAERQASAERAHYESSSETATLVGQPVVREGSAQTTARLIFLNQRTGEMQAEQNVRTTYFSSTAQPAGRVFHTAAPVHLTADRLRAERASGRARYEGHCRMWQGENVIQAGVMELYQKEKKLLAIGQVSSLFLQQQESGARAGPRRESWSVNIRAERLTYLDAERRAVYEGGATAGNGFGTLRSEQLEVFFKEAAGNQPAEIERALATGKVVILQPGRRARAEQAEYFAQDDKIVLSGGSPIVEDEERGSTSGRQLTYFLGDDRILVDSGEGVRTLTKHRVTK